MSLSDLKASSFIKKSSVVQPVSDTPNVLGKLDLNKKQSENKENQLS